MTIRIPEDRLRSGFQQIQERLGTALRGEITAYIGDPVSGDIFANNETADIYVHFSVTDPSGVTTISASGIPKDKLRYAQPILIKETPSRQFRYVGIDVQSDSIYSGGTTEDNTQDPVYLNQIRWGTIHPTTGLQVLVVSAFYDDDYVGDLITDAFDGTATDTSAAAISTPTTNNRTIGVLIQMDASTGTLEYKQSSEYSSAISNTQAYQNGLLPLKDANRHRVGYVMLKYGMTDITYGDIWEAPQLISTIHANKDLFIATADAVVANTTTETSLFGTGEGSLTLPANYLRAGRALHITMRGQISDTGTPTLNIKLKLGSTVIASTGATALTGISSVEWQIDLMLTCRSAGVSGVVVGGGLFDYDDGTEISLSSGSNATIDTTGSLALDVTMTWGTADALNTITTREATVEMLDPNTP